MDMYPLLPDEFVNALAKVYGVSERSMSLMARTSAVVAISTIPAELSDAAGTVADGADHVASPSASLVNIFPAHAPVVNFNAGAVINPAADMLAPEFPVAPFPKITPPVPA